MSDICGAKTRSGKPCKRSPMKNGRCKLHGGASLSGADNPAFKHGRYAKYVSADIQAKANDFSEGDILSLNDELSMQRSLFVSYLGRFKDIGNPSLGEISTMMGWLGDISKTVERIVKLQNETALTGAEIKFLQIRAVDLVMKYIPQPDQQEAFISELFGIDGTTTSVDNNGARHPQLIEIEAD